MSNDVDMTKVEEEEEEEEWIVLDEWNDGDDEKEEGEITDDEVNHSAQTIYSSEDETNDRYNRFKNERWRVWKRRPATGSYYRATGYLTPYKWTSLKQCCADSEKKPTS